MHVPCPHHMLIILLVEHCVNSRAWQRCTEFNIPQQPVNTPLRVTAKAKITDAGKELKIFCDISMHQKISFLYVPSGTY